jgi:hypothetical protein
LALNSPILESPESSSPIVTRAVAAGLKGEYCDSYSISAWQKPVLRALGALPQSAARFVLSRFETLSGLSPDRLAGLSIDTLVRARLADYEGLTGPFPAIILGAALGGASAHLSLALGGPFLPLAFVTTIKGGSQSGDVMTYFQQSARLARELAEQNPGVVTIQHYDPVHDGWMTRFANHLRFKLLELPPAYQNFIRERMAPGGTVCYLDCGAKWLRFKVGGRSYFQVGGWGGISAWEFLEGSYRLREYCKSTGLRSTNWTLPGYPLEQGPESEWGVEPEFGAALEDFCYREGFRFLRIALPEPHDYSRLAYTATARLLSKYGQEPDGVIIEMFSQFDATAVQFGGLLPVWLVFNTRDSLAFLKDMIPSFPSGKPIFFSPLATFSLTPDLVPWSEWEVALRGLSWKNIGARSSHYPADTRALVEWPAALRRWVNENKHPAGGCLDPVEIEELV